MCRLPLDLMTRIIGLVRVPLPDPGDPTSTWDDLRQRDLATLMRVSRLTYFIAAPLLYKEVVVNNLASFFLGIDDKVLSHHAECSDVPSTQSSICHAVIKRDASRYKCCRHPPSPSQDARNIDANEYGTFHKQQLLQMVEAVHFVYSSADRHMYNEIRLEDYVDEDGVLDDQVLRLVDVRRYLNVPECIQTGELRHPLPNLERLTVASWLQWNIDVNAIINATTMYRPGLSISKAYDLFERLLASRMYHFTAPFVCHCPCRGYLVHYPAPTTILCVNAIHETNPVTFGTYLQLGASNLVHFEEQYQGEDPFVWFSRDVFLVASELAQVILRWVESCTARDQVLSYTTITFVISRPNHHGDEVEDGMVIDELRETFKEALESYDLPDDWSEVNWDIFWEECVPPCPACAYEWTDQELYELYLRSPSPSLPDLGSASS